MKCRFSKFLTYGLIVLVTSAGTIDLSAQRKRSGQSKTRTETSGKNNSSKGTQGKKSTSGKGNTKKETSADVKRQAEVTSREIQQTKQQIEANEKKVRSGLAELSRLKSDIAVSDKKVGVLNTKVSSLATRISSLEKSIAEGNREIEKMRGEYLKAVKKMRLTRSGKSMLAFIFSAESFNQGLRRMRYLRQFSKWKEERSTEIRHRSEELQRQAQELEKSRKEQEEALVKQRAAQRQLEEQSRRQDALVVSLKQEGAALNTHLSKKQAEANQLKNRIAALIAAEEQQRQAEERRRQEEARIAAEKAAAKAAAEKAEAERRAAEKAEAERLAAEKAAAERAAADKNKSAQKGSDKYVEPAKKEQPKPKKEQPKKEQQKPKKEQPKKEQPKKEQPKKEPVKKEQPKPKTVAPSTAATGSGFASMKGSLPRPVEGHFRISSPFGRHSLPELPDVVYDNPGIDIEVSSGATAKAVFAGKVSGVYMIPGFGNVVIVNHGNHYTVYGNLSSVSVKVGDEVSQGRALGRVANDPDNSSYGSLHFEVWRNRDKLDPSGWIR